MHVHEHGLCQSQYLGQPDLDDLDGFALLLLGNVFNCVLKLPRFFQDVQFQLGQTKKLELLMLMAVSSSRSMAKTSPRPPMSRRWRPSARPRSPSWSRFCAEPPTPNLSARLLYPRSQTSVPRPTSPFSTSRLSQSCLPPRPKYPSWRSICFLRSESDSSFHSRPQNMSYFCLNPLNQQVRG